MSKRKSQFVIFPEIVDVKIEEDIEDPLCMINEEQFDSGGLKTRKFKSRKKSITEERILKKKSRSDSIPFKSISIALLKLEIHEKFNIYKLHCMHCDTSEEITDWKSFIKHLEKEHPKQIQNNTRDESPKKNEFIEERLNTSLNEEGAAEKIAEPVLEKTLPDSPVIKTEINFSDCEDFHDNAGDDDVDYGSEAGVLDDSMLIETKKKKIKLKSAKEEEDDNKRTYKKDERIITFTRTDKEIVVGFLEMVKEHPLLWQRRQSIMQRYDKVLLEMGAKFNAKYPKYEMSTNDMRLSIYRIKKLYDKALNPKESKNQNEGDASFKTKFPEYFTICTEIEEESKKMSKKCDHCGNSFIDEIDLQVHAFQVHRIGELPFKCNRCFRKFANEKKLSQHEKKDHVETPFVCVICNKSFDKEQKLHSHMAIHVGAKQICEICGKSFDSSYRYRRHMLHHAPPQFKCEICGKMLYEKYTLSEHMKTHFNQRQYACEICGKAFNINNGLQIHRRQVHKVKTQYVWGKPPASVNNNAIIQPTASIPQPVELTKSESNSLEQPLEQVSAQNSSLSHAVFQDRLFNDILSLQQHQGSQV